MSKGQNSTFANSAGLLEPRSRHKPGIILMDCDCSDDTYEQLIAGLAVTAHPKQKL